MLVFISCNDKKVFSEYKTDFKSNGIFDCIGIPSQVANIYKKPSTYIYTELYVDPYRLKKRVFAFHFFEIKNVFQKKKVDD